MSEEAPVYGTESESTDPVTVPSTIDLTQKSTGNHINITNFKVAAEYLYKGTYKLHSRKSKDWKFEDCTLSYKGEIVVSKQELGCNC